jgi:hypothetical protein
MNCILITVATGIIGVVLGYQLSAEGSFNQSVCDQGNTRCIEEYVPNRTQMAFAEVRRLLSWRMNMTESQVVYMVYVEPGRFRSERSPLVGFRDHGAEWKLRDTVLIGRQMAFDRKEKKWLLPHGDSVY